MGLRSLWALPVEVPFFLFYILIAAVIALELLRGNSSFTPAFYTLFLVQAFIDCTNYVLVRCFVLNKSRGGLFDPTA